MQTDIPLDQQQAERIQAQLRSKESKIAAGNAKKARKIARRALKNIARGKLDMPARSHNFPTLLLAQLSPEVSEGVIDTLAAKGVEADIYARYEGLGDWEDRIAVRSIAGLRIKPSPEYRLELEMRAINETQKSRKESITESTSPILVEQTGKYAQRIGEREYMTSDEPHGVVNFKRYADDTAYAEALSTKVIQCVDIIVHDTQRDAVLIGTRQQEPHAGDWVIGGGMRAGESVSMAAHRNMQRELGISIDDELLVTVGNYKFIWDSREQPPVNDEDGREVRGCHMSSTLVRYPLSRNAIDLDGFNEEYEGLRWVPTEEILTASEGKFHPCLVDMVIDMKEKNV